MTRMFGTTSVTFKNIYRFNAVQNAMKEYHTYILYLAELRAKQMNKLT
jgi:hypothetical protein